MKKLNTSPLSGMQELTPAAQAVFNQLKENIRGVYHHHGFLEIETPLIDRTEILLAKAGGDTEKQVYLVSKPAEAADEANQALRFDHTVPLARYVVEHENDLTFPFKVTQIGRNFRGERAQAGRYREFYQCDVDIVGRGSLPVAYDADAIATIYEALKTLNLPEMLIRISNRKVLAGFIESLGLSKKTSEISDVIDHAEKVPAEKTADSLHWIGLTDEQVEKVVAFTQISGTFAEVEPRLAQLGADNDTFREGVAELQTVYELLAAQGLGDNAVIDLLIVRGLDYYTGTVFETIIPEHRKIGSICSGGRYEDLATNFTEQKLPGVGGSIGLTRLFYILNEYQLLGTEIGKPLDKVIVPLSASEYAYAFEVAAELRANGEAVDVNLTLDKKLGDRLTYASRIARAAIVIGDREASERKYEIKEFQN